MSLLILTAFNSAYAPLGTLCCQSISRYALNHPHVRFVSRLIPEDYPKPPSWKKVELIRQYLPDHSHVFWLDCDAMIVGKQDIMQVINPTVTLNIARDDNGWNNGVACWRNCPEAFTLLDKLEAGYAEHKDSPWFEQSVLHGLESEVDAHEVPKHIWNAYPEEVTGGGDQTKETLILHFPGMGEERLSVMQKYLPAA